MKSMTYNCLLETLVYNKQYEGENGATTLILDYAGAHVDSYVKHISMATSDGRVVDYELGTSVTPTLEIPDEWLIRGRGMIQPYAVNGETIVRFPIKPINVLRSVV